MNNEDLIIAGKDYGKAIDLALDMIDKKVDLSAEMSSFKMYSPKEVIEIYHRTGFLVYHTSYPYPHAHQERFLHSQAKDKYEGFIKRLNPSKDKLADAIAFHLSIARYVMKNRYEKD